MSYPSECAVICYLGHEIIIAVALKRPVFLYMAFCNLIDIYRHFDECATSVLRWNTKNNNEVYRLVGKSMTNLSIPVTGRGGR
jgi:hypothetical protein